MKKQIIFSLLLAMTGVMFAGCEKTPDGGAFFLNSNVLLEFPGEGGSQDISFFSSYAWSVTSSADWCKVSSQPGSGGLAKITVAVGKGSDSPRRATITISSNGQQETVAVSQKRLLIATVEIPKTPKDGFWMGTNDEDPNGHNYYSGISSDFERPVHQVKLSAFRMGITEVTNAQYATFLNEAKIAYSATVDYDYPPGTKHKGCTGLVTVDGVTATHPLLYDGTTIFDGADPTPWGITYANGQWVPMHGYENHPVINVTWFGAKAFCDWLSGETGHTWRLPTEAEWEYACRGGHETAWFFGSIEDDLGNYAWFETNSGNKTHAVGQKDSNPYGLYDMYGNVAEWCESYWTASYSQEDMEKPRTNTRMIRGGNYPLDANLCRSAVRNWGLYNYATFHLGFRVVLVP